VLIFALVANAERLITALDRIYFQFGVSGGFMSSATKVWFVTGASKGLGLTLVRRLLAQGNMVAATSRTREALESTVSPESTNFLPLQVDLADEERVAEAITRTVAKFGRIDVVVNNAGYGQQGTFEGLSDEEFRKSFEVNVFAPLNVLRHCVPYLRRQRSGHIFNISSIVGFNGGYAGWGCYVGTKFALSGMSEALAAEVSEFGVKATAVYPGPIRTDFLSSGSLLVAKTQIDEYTQAKASLDLHLNELAGKQAGDPEKMAQAIIDTGASEQPPVHLFLGKIAFDLGHAKIEAVQHDLQAWMTTSTNVDYVE
jgi:NAD(P)-dependent dehydrogenase (short-subunit alcohol dehydrogenase family)